MFFVAYLGFTAAVIWAIDYLFFGKGRERKLPEIPSMKLPDMMLSKKDIYERMKNMSGNHIVWRHQLDDIDKDITEPLATKTVMNRNEMMKCYGCGKITRRNHPVYVFSCRSCGSLFQKHRHFSSTQNDKVILITNIRQGLGHHVALKLLRAGATVIGTSRSPQLVRDNFIRYVDYEGWKDKLVIYEKPIDFSQALSCNEFVEEIQNKFGCLDAFIHIGCSNSSDLEKSFEEITHQDLEKEYRMSASNVAVLSQSVIPLLQKSKGIPYFINVHARAGLMMTSKDERHIHVNMAKAALAMLTKSLCALRVKTMNDIPLRIHGIDPGWYSQKDHPFGVPPLDVVDAAARVCFPLFNHLKTNQKTQRHFIQYKY